MNSVILSFELIIFIFFKLCTLTAFVRYAYCVGICEYKCVSDGASKGVLNVQKYVYLSLRKVNIQKVTVVEFRMYNSSGDVL